METNRRAISKILRDQSFIAALREHSMKMRNGGPFGAIIFKNGKIVGIGFNEVLKLNDPTAHAEIQAIRNACGNLNTYDLTGCEIYATGFPCPMCMSAIIWSNMKKVYYSADYKDAEVLGFRDSFIYNFIKNGQSDDSTLELLEVEKDSIIKLYNDYKREGEIY